MDLLGLGAGAGLGLLKGWLVDGPRIKRENKMAAVTARYSPWTGLQPGKLHESDPLGDALTYGAAGAQMAQNSENADAQKELTKAQSAWLSRNPYNPAAGAAMATTVAPPATTGFTYEPGQMAPTGYKSKLGWM